MALATRPIAVIDDGSPRSASAAPVASAGAARIELVRRGCFHGAWLELEPGAEPIAQPISQPEDAAALAARRWHASRPVLLPRAAEGVDLLADQIEAALQEREDLAEPGGLRALVAAALDERETTLRALPPRPRAVAPRSGARADDAIERVAIASDPPGARGRRIKDLWAEAAWTSSDESDGSLALRLGAERRDVDDGLALVRHRLLAELAGRLLPESAALTADPLLVAAVERMIGEPVLFAEAAATWTSPEGGAPFQAARSLAALEHGYLGTVHVQLAGRAAWLALSSEDLARSAQGFVAELDGDLAWIGAQLYGDPGALERVRRLAGDVRALQAELELAGCGILGRLVDRGPEFTSRLAREGHAAILRPGDVLLLPSHGPGGTALASTFAASAETAYGISLAIRSCRPPPEPPAVEDRDRGAERRAWRSRGSERSPRERIRRRR